MKFLSTLNPNQLEAVTTESKITRIIAGAGSGKTRVLTFRIAYLIKEFGVDPRSILAITFTNKVAKEMVERVDRLLSETDTNSGVRIYTYHALCAKFLRVNAAYIGYPSNYSILDDQDQELILKKIFRKHGVALKDKEFKVSESLKYISFHKQQGLGPIDVKLETDDPKILFYQKVFVEYEEKKSTDFALDFDDLLTKTRDLLKNNESIRKRYQAMYSYVLIDEFQDTNLVQYEIVKLLVGPETELYVVGDPDQTIYSWRGASLDIIINLNRDYQDVKTIILNENYRSTKNILNRANRLISHNKNRVKKDLFTSNNDGEPVIVKEAENAAFEAKYVVHQILELIKKGIPRKHIAILFRANSVSKDFEKELLSRRIPYKVFGESVKFFQRAEVKDVIAYLQLISNENANFAIERIINVPGRGIGQKYSNCIYEEHRSSNLPLIEFFKVLPTLKTEIPNKISANLADLSDYIKGAREALKQNAEDAPSEIISRFLNQIGYFEYLKEGERFEERKENVETLLEDFDSYMLRQEDGTLSEYLQQITLLSSQDELDAKDFISLMTVHTAKGLEFEYVFLVSFSDHSFPNKRALDEGGNRALEEERRLAYVAFTRAKKHLFISMNYSFNGITHERSRPSRFLIEAGFFFEERYFDNRYSFVNTSVVFEEEKIKDQEVRVIETYEVGDKVYHTAFKEGVVVEASGNKVKIQFEVGTKILTAPHPSYHKI